VPRILALNRTSPIPARRPRDRPARPPGYGRVPHAWPGQHTVTCPAREPDQRSHPRILARRRTEVPFGRGTDSRAGRRGVAQSGGYLSGCAKTNITLRDRLSSGFVLRWQSPRLPTDSLSMAKVSCRTRGHDPVRMQNRTFGSPRWTVMERDECRWRPLRSRHG
jgi:hypothetical protein